MERPVDLPRIRRALSELDRIAAEHPEICQGIGQWTEQAVEKMTMGTPANERASAFRRRLAEKGIKREIFFATPEARDALVQLRALHPDKTRDRILCDAVLNLLTTAPVSPAPSPPPVETMLERFGEPATPATLTVDAPASKPTAVDATLELFGEPEAPASNHQRAGYLPEPPTAPTGRDALMTWIGERLAENLTGAEIARRLNASGKRKASGAEFLGANIKRDYRAWCEKTGNVDTTRNPP